MVKSCCVKSCRAEWSPKTSLSFFSIPMKNESLLNKWKEAIPATKISKYTKICSKHFSSDEIQRVGAKTILKKNAVPTIFHNERLQPKVLGSDNFQSTPNSTHFIKIRLIKSSALKETLRNTTTDDVKSNASSFSNKVLLHSCKIQDQGVTEPSNKKDISVQTSPRRVGPSEREIWLQRKIKMLHDKLRRREKILASTRDLVKNLKKQVQPPDKTVRNKKASPVSGSRTLPHSDSNSELDREPQKRKRERESVSTERTPGGASTIVVVKNLKNKVQPLDKTVCNKKASPVSGSSTLLHSDSNSELDRESEKRERERESVSTERTPGGASTIVLVKYLQNKVQPPDKTVRNKKASPVSGSSTFPHSESNSELDRESEKRERERESVSAERTPGGASTIVLVKKLKNKVQPPDKTVLNKEASPVSRSSPFPHSELDREPERERERQRESVIAEPAPGGSTRILEKTLRLVDFCRLIERSDCNKE